jgi:hypothetical protein
MGDYQGVFKLYGEIQREGLTPDINTCSTIMKTIMNNNKNNTTMISTPVEKLLQLYLIYGEVGLLRRVM